MLFNAGLVLHICGISLMTGMTVASFVTYRQLFISLNENRNGSAVMLHIVKLIGKLQVFGGVLIVAGGAMMMSVFGGMLAEQPWFKIKMLLLLALISNVSFLFRPANIRLLLLLEEQQANAGNRQKVRRLFMLFHALQVLILISIFVLSVFRFN